MDMSIISPNATYLLVRGGSEIYVNQTLRMELHVHLMNATVRLDIFVGLLHAMIGARTYVHKLGREIPIVRKKCHAVQVHFGVP
jgi:hypothetical protein